MCHFFKILRRLGQTWQLNLRELIHNWVKLQLKYLYNTLQKTKINYQEKIQYNEALPLRYRKLNEIENRNQIRIYVLKSNSLIWLGRLTKNTNQM